MNDSTIVIITKSEIINLFSFINTQQSTMVSIKLNIL
jgi:hypothetical protein